MGILSIQSHVAYGHVGNAAAVFPLQRLGLDVWPVHCLQFSNHVGYPDWEGMVFPTETIEAVIAGIERRGALTRCQAVLSGYMGSASLAEVVAKTVERARAANPGALFACDPVMGDTGIGLYVEPAIPEAMRERLVPAADLITPNQFELELLTGQPITSLAEALLAVRAALAMGPRVVLLTSLRHAETPDDAIEMLVATNGRAFRVRTPYLAMDPMPHGSGDATAALFLAHLLRGGGSLAPDAVAKALGEAAAAIYAIMAESQRASTGELALVAAQEELAAPTRRFEVIAVE